MAYLRAISIVTKVTNHLHRVYKILNCRDIVSLVQLRYVHNNSTEIVQTCTKHTWLEDTLRPFFCSFKVCYLRRIGDREMIREFTRELVLKVLVR